MKFSPFRTLLNRLFRPTTDKALGGINRGLKQLERVVEIETLEANQHAQAMADHAKAREEALNRSRRAARVAEKLADLVA